MGEAKRGDELAIKYAENRAEFLAIKKELATIPYEAFSIIHREADDWREAQKENGPYGFEQWEGWVSLLDNGDQYDEGAVGDVYRIATLWDRRKSLAAPLGTIRRSIAAHGRALISKREKEDG